MAVRYDTRKLRIGDLAEIKWPLLVSSFFIRRKLRYMRSNMSHDSEITELS